MRLVTIDLDTNRIIEMEGKVLKGECLQCGKCCKDCEELFIDSYKDHEQKKPIYSCKLQGKKPFFCVLHPLTWTVSPEGCGLHWENK